MAGRPRLHPTRADKQFAYRQRKSAERDKERDQLAAWCRVREAATATGILIGDESDFVASQKIIAQIGRLIETSAPLVRL
jgi:hypothetical protein